MKIYTKEDFIAQRYILLRKQLWLYRHIFLARDRNTNSEVILDRNLAVINAVIPDLWGVISFSLFQSVFSVLGDMFDVRSKTKGSVLHKLRKTEKSDESLLRQLKEHKLEHYYSLIKKLYVARDEYIAHTDKYTDDKFPIETRDMNRLEKLLDEVDEKILRTKIKESSEYYFYKEENCDDDVLQQFDHLMNVLYLDYHSYEEQMDDDIVKKRELVMSESLKRRQELVDKKRKLR